MATITVPGMFLTGTHAARPAANAVGIGTLYACSTHALVYQSDGSSWAQWFDGGAATISAGSNSTHVREVATAGASSTLWSPYDHAHAGVAQVTSSSSNTLQRGTVNIRAGANIGITATDTDGDGEFDTLTIHGSAAGGGGGSSLTVADEGSPLSTAATTLDFVGAGVTASGSGATKTITISGGGGSTFQLDVPPTSPDADDDEFPGTSLSGAWTDPLTSASGQTNLVDVRDGRLYFEPATSGTSSTGKHVFGIRKASPSGSFTVSAKMMSSHSGDDVRGGLYIGTAGGRGHMVGPSPQDGTAAYIAATTISNSADWSSFDSHSGLAAYYSYFPMWVRIRWDAGATTLYADLSMNGTIWRQVYSRGSMAQPDQMGFAIYSNTGTIPAHAGLAAEWFRVIDGSAAFTPY